MSKSKMKYMGIHGREILACGCVVKHYFGGKTVTDGCERHKSKVEYICAKCGENFGKIAKNGKNGKTKLKEHQWSHAV